MVHVRGRKNSIQGRSTRMKQSRVAEPGHISGVSVPPGHTQWQSLFFNQHLSIECCAGTFLGPSTFFGEV